LKNVMIATVLAVLAVGCAAPQPAALAPSTADAADLGQRLDQLAEAYFEEMLALYPVRATQVGDNRYNHLYTVPFSTEVRERTAEISERYLRQLRAIDREALDQHRRLTYDVFQHNLESEFAAQRFPSHLQPLNQFFNFTAPFVEMGSGTGIHPFRTVKDYDDFLSRINGFEEGVDVAIANMREGIAAGVVQPRLLMERVLPQLSAHLAADVESSLFWGPILRLPEDFPAAERERLSAAYARAIREQLMPTFGRLHDFVRDEYLPHTRETHGFWALPDGRAWYDHRVRASTTTSLTADEVHQIGLAEVARIHQEMERVKEQVGFQGTLAEFLRHMQTDPRHFYETRAEMLADYRAAQAAIDASTDRLFDVRPRADYEIRPVEPFYERSFSGGSYTAASPDGSRPGVFRLNTYEPASRPRYARTALLLHEGSPGHHFQITIQRELEHLPRIRRFGGNTAYVEGWALYAETLGEELGVYTDPYQHYGVLDGELWRAIRLVLDTGIHARGWTREQAIEYALQNSSVAETYAASEVERFMAIPGQALAYKIGQMKLAELRRRAEAELGPRFDVRAFHRAVLEDGALPLGVLEAKIERWIAERRS